MLRVPNSILVFPKFGLVLSARNWYLYDLIHCNRNRNRIRNRNQNLKSSMGRTLCNLLRLTLTLYISGRIVAPKIKGINYIPTWVCACCRRESGYIGDDDDDDEDVVGDGNQNF